MKKLLLCFIAIISVQVSIAQTEAFSSDPTKFYDEIEKFMRQGASKEMKDFMKEFEEVWFDGPFAIYQEQVIKFSNDMLKKKYRAVAHFQPYYRAVMDYHYAGHPKTNFDVWQQGLNHLLKKKSGTYLVKYIEASNNLFKDNAVIVLPGHTWYTEGNLWKIEFTDAKKIQKRIRWVFPGNDLYCVGKNDTTIIHGTTGIYYPLEKSFDGKGGQIFWLRHKIDPDKVSVVLNNYHLNVKRSTFKADSVMFTHKDYFPTPLMGKFEEKLTDIVEGYEYKYPKFDSYSKRFEIKNIFEGIDYEGGFSFYGHRFIAKGDSSNQAYLNIYDGGELRVRTAASSYSIEPDKINASNTTVTVYIENDSIYHPGLDFKYLDKIKTKSGNDSLVHQVELIRDEMGISATPFKDTYHKTEIVCARLFWKIGEKFLRVSSGRGADQNVTKFRSFEYFNELEFERLQGLDEIHPLVKLRKYIFEENDTNPTFTALQFAQFLRFDLSKTRQMLINFSIAGVLTYDVKTETATINERFFHMINAASQNGDYDVIEIYSQMPRNRHNAQLSFLDYRWDIEGVNNIIISDSQAVEIIPYGRKITLKKDRDLSFNGRVFAGRFFFYGHNFDFSYKNFKFKSSDIDSLKIIAKTYKPDMFGLYPDTVLHSKIEDMAGEIFVDHPNNRAGLKDFPEYPTFNSTKKSYVYYEYPFVESGVYKKNEFYFMVDPFKMDTLDDFQTKNFDLKGTFTSAGIFPDLREELIIMPDYSMGFFRRTDHQGLPAYDNKATYYDTLTLSHRGLRGAGTLDYLTSVAKSRDFVFYPDSMNTFAETFSIKEQKGGIETPDVKAKNVIIHWEPDNENFSVTETGSMFEMYNGDGTMNGTLVLTPNGLIGDGDFHLGVNADMVSDQFHFKSKTFSSDTTNFSLTDMPTEQGDTAQVAFKTDNVKADVTFIDRKATLRSNSDDSYVEFPQNKFIAYMEEMEYMMDSNTVDLNSRKVDEIGLKGALFVSTDPKLDSLAFVAPRANFIVNDHLIDCHGVKYIDVADSRIFPLDENLKIRKNSKIDPLVDAKVWVGKDDKRHVLEKANVTIFTSHRYAGTAEYTFVDEIGTPTVIKLTKVDVDEKDVTVGEGLIEQIADFSMSPNFGFKGTVHLYGMNHFLTFDGYTKVNHNCQYMGKDWMRFQAEIDPNNILIPIKREPKNDDQKDLINGFLFASDSSGIYPAMLRTKRRYSDVEVLKVGGYIYFDKKTQEFKITHKKKLTDPELPGNYMSFNTKTCTSFGEGKMDLGAKLGQVDLEASGTITHPEDSNVTMDILLTMDFKMDPSMFKFIEDKIETVEGDGLDIDQELIRRSITDLLDSGKADKLYEKLDLKGFFKRLPSKLKKTLVLTDVHFNWDRATRSLRHSGKVGLMVFNDKQVNKVVDAFIELDRKASGDRIYVYLEFDYDHWYYFEYRTKVMYIRSGIKEFNDILAGLDNNKRQFHNEGKDPYSIAPAPQSRVDKFKKKFGVVNDN